MGKAKTLNNTHTFIWIIVGVFTIIAMGYAGIVWAKPAIEKWFEGDDFIIRIEPDFISVGQYGDGFPIKIVVENLDKNNITSFSLKKEDIAITRLNKNSQTQTSTQLQGWDRYTRGDYVFNENSYTQVGKIGKLEAEAEMWGCDNCFVGESSPYQFEFVIYYAKNGEDLRPITKIIELPLIN